MQTRNPSDDELWDVCKTIPSDWEPYGQRRFEGREQDRPDCTACAWFVELFRTRPDWGCCANIGSPRAGLLTFRKQGCWLHEPMKETRHDMTRPAQCDFMRAFEKFLRELAADFIRDEVRKANDPLPDMDASAITMEHIRQIPLSVVVHRLLRHADEDFRRSAFDRMTASARNDTRRFWEFARCYWSRRLGVDISEIALPENKWELEQKFWGRVDATISEALGGRDSQQGPRHQNRPN